MHLESSALRGAVGALIVTLAASVATPAHLTAQQKQGSASKTAREYNFEIRPAIGVVFPTSPDGLDTGWDIGGGLRITPPGWDVGLQLDLMAIDLNSTLFQATLEAVYQFGSSTNAFRPYIIGGLGIYDGDFGLNAGLGVDFAVVNAPFGFFAETRFHRVFEDPDDVSFIPINVGIRIRF